MKWINKSIEHNEDPIHVVVHYIDALYVERQEPMVCYGVTFAADGVILEKRPIGDRQRPQHWFPANNKPTVERIKVFPT